MSRARERQWSPAPGDDLALRAASSRRRRFFVLSICCVSLFMNYLDGTILNVALPAIQRSFHASVAELQWVIDSFFLVLTSLLLLAGSVADRFGRRRLLGIGLAVFCLGSLACSIAPNVDALIGARMAQAVGGSMLVPTTLSIIRNTFTDRNELAHALGVWSGVFGLASACGPLIGGFLVDFVGWRSVFVVNVPVGVAGLIVALRFVPESRAERPRHLDPVGQVLIIVFLTLLVYAIIEGPSAGWTSRSTVAAFAGSAVFFVVLLVVERGREEPILEIRFFKSPSFSGANAIATLSFVMLAGFLFLNTLYLQQVRGDSALVAGVAILPLMATMAVVAPFSGRFMATHGPRPAMTGSAVLCVAGFALLLGLTPTTPYGLLVLAYVALGFGFGIANPTLTHTAVAGMPARQAGVASAITSTCRQVGSALGVALMGSLAVTSYHSLLGTRLATLRVPTPLATEILDRGFSAVPLPDLGVQRMAILASVHTSFASATRLGWIVAVGCGITWFFVALVATNSASLARSVRQAEDGAITHLADSTRSIEAN